MGSTKVELVEALRQKPQTERRDEMIALALKGYFHDFESPYDLPKVALVRALQALGYVDLAGLAEHGEYDDEPPTRAQAAELEAIWSEMQREDPRAAQQLADVGRAMGAPPPGNRAERRGRRS